MLKTVDMLFTEAVRLKPVAALTDALTAVKLKPVAARTLFRITEKPPPVGDEGSNSLGVAYRIMVVDGLGQQRRWLSRWG